MELLLILVGQGVPQFLHSFAVSRLQRPSDIKCKVGLDVEVPRYLLGLFILTLIIAAIRLQS